jgi:hypothetical protein
MNNTPFTTDCLAAIFAKSFFSENFDEIFVGSTRVKKQREMVLLGQGEL